MTDPAPEGWKDLREAAAEAALAAFVKCQPGDDEMQAVADAVLAQVRIRLAGAPMSTLRELDWTDVRVVPRMDPDSRADYVHGCPPQPVTADCVLCGFCYMALPLLGGMVPWDDDGQVAHRGCVADYEHERQRDGSIAG